MELGTFNAGLVWAMPVRPDLLGFHLEAYKKALPTLRALRLCHRFGTGPKVHITKLPAEIELLIEDHIFEAKKLKVTTKWLRSFDHFESRCEPIDHALTTYFCIFGDVEAEDEVQEMLCEKCKRDGCSSDCGKGCVQLVDEHINEGLYERDDRQLNRCMKERDRWEALINQAPNGKFAKYDKLLQEEFGLRAYFETTRATEENKKSWPIDPHHKWHVGEPLETTICFLHLPGQLTGDTHYAASEIEGEAGFLKCYGSQSYFVELSDVNEKEKHLKRVEQFKRVLRCLRLKPYVHPSQLNAKVSAETSPKKDLPTRSKPKVLDDANRDTTKDGDVAGDGDTKKDGDTAKDKEMAQIEWPKLVMLVKTQFELG